MYYHEKYDFVLHDEKYAISADTELNTINDYTITGAVPGKVYTFKYEIVNYSGIDNAMELRFDPNTDMTEAQLKALKTIDVRIGYIDSEGKPVFTAYQSLKNYTKAEGMTIAIPVSQTTDPETLAVTSTTLNTIPAASDDINVEGEDTSLFGRYDFWLQIKIDNEATLEFDELTLPDFRLLLKVDYKD